MKHAVVEAGTGGGTRTLRKPSPGTVLGTIALVVAMAGTAFAATGQLVNIADPTNANRIARVNSSGQLQTVVNGSITAREAVPADLFRDFGEVTSNSACDDAATPPAGSALVIETVNISVLSVGASNPFVELMVGQSCPGSLLANVDIAERGLVTFPMQPGIAIPAGQRLWARGFGGVSAEVTTFGYKVPAGSVPAQSIAQVDAAKR